MSFGVSQEVPAGTNLFAAGDLDPDFFVLAGAQVALVVSDGLTGVRKTIAFQGPTDFVGELGQLTHQAAFVTARVTQSGPVWRIPADRIQELMSRDGSVAEVFMQTFQARREWFLEFAGDSLIAAGREHDSVSNALRAFLVRMRLPHRWIDEGDPAAARLQARYGIGALPLVAMEGHVLTRAAPDDVAEKVGHAYRRSQESVADMLVIGGGPAGMAAAVYGASEGLDTVCVDGVGPGGQAAATSRIENYLGFPEGLSGDELLNKAALQALKFGAGLHAPLEVVALEPSGPIIRVALRGPAVILARTVVIATGVRYRNLDIDRWADFIGAGIYYGASDLEARQCQGQGVIVVGGGNSAGQACLYLAQRDCDVTLVIRGGQLDASMSAYLVSRIRQNSCVRVLLNAEVRALHGERNLEAVTISSTERGPETLAASALFCFVGAVPDTDWLPGLALDDHGFVLTGAEAQTTTSANNPPLPFETSLAGVFAAGDVRSGSMKRVAAAAGEGASAVASVHRRLAVLDAAAIG
ncbi:FAD-dependent oxidoreductase [Frondihabitans peucedani]|uniref:FAD-dependent oxidoreductase n=2 Tax=Frondihabitans peucedani TaxID=598626 RepID=A0ABP8E1C9_9MICO